MGYYDSYDVEGARRRVELKHEIRRLGGGDRIDEEVMHNEFGLRLIRDELIESGAKPMELDFLDTLAKEQLIQLICDSVEDEEEEEATSPDLDLDDL